MANVTVHPAKPPSMHDSMPTVQPVGAPALANETFIRVARDAMASVVNISSTRKIEESSQRNRPVERNLYSGGQRCYGLCRPFHRLSSQRRFFGEKFKQPFRRQQPKPEQGLGSGVIVSSDGYIVTNNHVVGQADEITVLLGDKRTLPAQLIGTDPKTDLAVIKINETNLPTLQWGNSGNLQVGELVLAVGNPFGLNQTVTMGIISATGRANMGIVDYEDFIQTDAAINPGNSGGALVNLHGELIGINTAIFSRTGGYMGIGFAIPSNMVKNVMNNLVDHGKVIRGWLGVSIQPLTPELAKQFEAPDSSGALVGEVVAGSPAEDAGLQRGDIIRDYNRTQVNDPIHLRSLIADTKPGTSAVVSVLRNSSTKELSVAIGELPKNLTTMRQSDRDSQRKHALTGIIVDMSQDEGVFISQARPESAAARAGLRRGDIIVEINRRPVRTVDDFHRLTSDLGPQTPVLILLKRGNGTIYVSIQP